MPKPVAGKPYTIVRGDNLSRIAAAAYGSPREWRRIWKANQTVLRSGDPNLIFPGEIINIPPEKPEVAEPIERPEATDLAGKAPDDFTLVIDGTEIPVMDAQIMRTADTVADGWVASVSRDSSDARLKELLRPFMYRPAKVYLGGKLQVDGRVYTVQHTITEANGLTCALEGWSSTADIIDSTMRPPLEANKITLEKRARDLLDPLGISVIWSAGDDAPFDRVTSEPTETISDHLLALAKQRGVMMTSTPTGEVEFVRASAGRSVGTIEEGRPPFQSVSARFDGRDRFNRYKALAQSPGKNARSAVAEDSRVPTTRFLTFNADETSGGDIQRAANWRRSKQVAESLSIKLPVPGWYAPDGSLWAPNTTITLKSPSIYLDDGFNLLIRDVEYNFRSDGVTSLLTLVPVESLSGDNIDEPW